MIMLNADDDCDHFAEHDHYEDQEDDDHDHHGDYYM